MLKILQSLGIDSLAIVDPSQVKQGIHIITLDLEYLFEFIHRFIVTVFFKQCHTEIIVSLDTV